MFRLILRTRLMIFSVLSQHNEKLNNGTKIEINILSVWFLRVLWKRKESWSFLFSLILGHSRHTRIASLPSQKDTLQLSSHEFLRVCLKIITFSIAVFTLRKFLTFFINIIIIITTVKYGIWGAFFGAQNMVRLGIPENILQNAVILCQ